jgi:hypothetical protein
LPLPSIRCNQRTYRALDYDARILFFGRMPDRDIRPANGARGV